MSNLPVESYDVVNVDSIAATIRKEESGGNYQAQSKNSTASGAYQFLDTTWQGLAKRYGLPDAMQYAKASQAPPNVQDEVAKRYISDILSANNNNVAAVPATWYVGSVNAAEMMWNTTPAGNSISVKDYVNRWLNDFHTISGQNPGSTSVAGAVGGVITNLPSIGGQAVSGALSSFSTIGDLISAISRTLFNPEWWKWIGIGGLGLLLIVFAFKGTETGQTVVNTTKGVAETAAKAGGAM